MRNPFEMESLVDWLSLQPPEKSYHYCNNKGCLIFQYLKAKGFSVNNVSSLAWIDGEGKSHRLPPGFNAVAILSLERTFGDALKNAKSYVAGTLDVQEWVS